VKVTTDKQSTAENTKGGGLNLKPNPLREHNLMNQGKLLKNNWAIGLILLCGICLARPAMAYYNATTLQNGINLVCSQQKVFTVPGNPHGKSDAHVEWMVAGVPGGNGQVGTISASGLYTAPRSAPGSALEIAAVDEATGQTLSVAKVTVVENPQVDEAHERWLAGATEAAAEHGCQGELVRQLPTETVDDAIKFYLQVATAHTCLLLQPVSDQPDSQRYSFASGGEKDGVNILYISDVSQIRIWNGAEVAGQ
jgi:hypothetical protein